MNLEQAWLVGIIDGEGCFQINTHGLPNLSVMVSNRDAQLVDRCLEAAGAGRVNHYPHAPRVPVSCWGVRSKSDLLAVVAILDEFPLRGKKQVEYVLWREAVLLYQTRRVGGNLSDTAAHNAPITQRLLELRRSIMALR